MFFLKRTFSIITLIALILLIPAWFIFFINSPNHLDNLKAVAVPIFDLLGLGAIIGAYRKKIVEEVSKSKNISNAILLTIEKEWLIKVVIWILLLISVVLFIYLMPVFKILIDVKDKDLPEDMNIELQLLYQSQIYNIPITRFDNDSSIFKSDRVLSWGDSLQVVITSNLKSTPYYLKWPSFGLSKFKNGIKQSITLPKNRSRINISTYPVTAKASIYFDDNYDSPDAVKASYLTNKHKPINIHINAVQYSNLDTIIIPTLDTHNLKFILKPLPGNITFHTFTEGGKKIESMIIYINDDKINQKSWEKLTLQPGSYKVYLKKELVNNETYLVDTFYFEIKSNEIRVDTKTAHLR